MLGFPTSRLVRNVWTFLGVLVGLGGGVGLGVVAPAVQAGEPFSLREGDRVVFLGDSITQNGRYVVDVEAYLMTRFPDRTITVINHGLSSETVAGTSEPGHAPRRPWVLDRFERDGLAYKPTMLMLCYGMNDGSYAPPSDANQRLFRDGMTTAIGWAWSGGAVVNLLTPPPYDAYRRRVGDPEAKHYGYRFPAIDYDDTLRAYAAWEVGLTSQDYRTVIGEATPADGTGSDNDRAPSDGRDSPSLSNAQAPSSGQPSGSDGQPPSEADATTEARSTDRDAPAIRSDLAVTDLHTFVNDVLAARREGDVSFTFADDGVHPGSTGHLLMAQAVLEGWNAPAFVDRAEISVSDKKATAVRGEVADLEAGGDRVAFTWTMPLPWPLPSDADARTVELAQTHARLNQIVVAVADLAEGDWTLTHDGQPLATASATSWAEGVTIEPTSTWPTASAAAAFRAALQAARADDYQTWRKHMAAGFTAADVPKILAERDAATADREAALRRMVQPQAVTFALIRATK